MLLVRIGSPELSAGGADPDDREDRSDRAATRRPSGQPGSATLTVLGADLAPAGWHDLEEQVDWATLLKRIAAAMLMTAAIALSISDMS
ncbi:MAG: hypothetical protein NT171_08670 [Planctomycetota bacterium]|nr:hypothetical protein [Planctomycetota bacterium]